MTMRVSIALGTLIFAACVNPAAADVECGDSITENTRLTHDLTCSVLEGPALTVVGPAKLSLNGHSLTCTADRPRFAGVGIILTEKNAAIWGGKIVNCYRAVEMRGSYQRAERLIITTDDLGWQYLAVEGIFFGGNHNRVSHNTIILGRVTLDGDHNKVQHNIIYDNGITLTRGKNGRIHYNRVIETGTYQGNNGGPHAYIGITDSDGATMTRNSLLHIADMRQGSEHWGIIVSGSKDVTVRHNTVENAAIVSSDRQGRYDPEENRITRNRVRGGPDFDLIDEHYQCAGTAWRRNTFETANRDCIH